MEEDLVTFWEKSEDKDDKSIQILDFIGIHDLSPEKKKKKQIVKKKEAK